MTCTKDDTLLKLLWALLITLMLTTGISVAGIGFLANRLLILIPIEEKLDQVGAAVVPIQDHDERWARFFELNPGLVNPKKVARLLSYPPGVSGPKEK